MRILMLSKALVVGTYRSKLAAMAIAPDVDLTVVVPPYWREGAQRLGLEPGETPGYRLLVSPMVLNGSYHLHFYPWFGRLVRRLRPDLVHVDEEPYNLATSLALRSAQRNGARTLFFTWQNLHRRYPIPFSWMEQYAYRTSDGAIAGNHAAADVLRAKGFQRPIAVIPQFGVDPDIFRPSDRPAVSEGPYTIGFAGRLIEDKGLLVLLQALRGLPGDWRLCLYGDGPLLPTLRTQAQQDGLSERLEWHPRVPSSDMPAILAGLDVLVLPSLTRPNWMEQFGRVLIEAMACGTPVIGSDSGEIPHVIGEGGLVVPEGDASALSNALRRLQEDAALRRNLVERGRRRVLEHYTQARIADETIAFYRATLGEASPIR
ncbi:MAG: glycosyltransferase family 4 protein [Anaerolineae bacterium]|nr:glycosyltransferase family 4 protein [Chloroflexota bacterium]